VIKTFPLASVDQGLIARDFQRFSHAFADIVLRQIPIAKQVQFISNGDDLKNLVKDKRVDDLVLLFDSVCKNVNRCGVYQDLLMIPFTLNDETIVVAVLSRIDTLFTKRVGDDWLSDAQNVMHREFLLLKQARIDGHTGFFNLSNLMSLLGNLSAEEPVQLTLLEIPSRKSSFQLTTNHLYKCVSTLQVFIPDGSVIHHLGNSLFAFVSELRDGNDYSRHATSLVGHLKSEGFQRVNIGISHYNNTDTKDIERGSGKRLLDEAWTALLVALKRGPFGFCDFSLLAYPENHPLVRPEQNLVRRLRRLWKKSEQFFLVQFRSDNACYPVDKIVSPFIDNGTVVQSGNDCIVYLDQREERTVLDWTANIVRQCREFDSGKTVSAGVACFPYNDFKKTEILYNCHKALAHAAFFGSGGVALFDAVSLNISGDIYFSDGDLVKAVKEYRRGLKCDEGNVNLHNSLGVTFTMMNRLSAAMICFEKALELDENSFMALYNIGLGELHHDRKKTAIIYFKKALDCIYEDGSDDGPALKKDLRRQIGILASETGDHQLALDYLLPWYESSFSKRYRERVTFNIGRSYYGLRQNRKAMEWLQRALRNNEYDDRAMHFLGKVYHEEGEGDEIALSLCRKSLELDPDNTFYLLELAHLQFHCGMISDACDNLKKCLKSGELKLEAQLFLTRCYLKTGHHRKALNWFNKVDAEDGKSFKLYSQLKQEFLTIT
jgi:tetratricopeptide (TPR) repeat protein